MEKVLDVYRETYDAEHPLNCMGEAAEQVTSDGEPALPISPGQPRRDDHHYERQRNEQHLGVHWQFTTTDARIKLISTLSGGSLTDMIQNL